MPDLDKFAGLCLPAVEVPLDDGWRLAWCIEEDGSTSAWLLSPDEVGELGCRCSDCCGHEQLGPLPRALKLSVGLRCEVYRSNGLRCMNVVRPGQQLCAHHRATVDA
jgi:hypothetical protein